MSGEPGPHPSGPATAPPARPPASPPSSFERHKTLIITGAIVGAAILLAVGIGLGLGWIGGSSGKDLNRVMLYGNVDLREVDLSFNDSERIAEVLVQEGDRVRRGQVLARLDTSRLRPEAAAAEASVQAQQAVVDRLHHGSRPQETAQAQANVAAAEADQVNAGQQWTRMSALTTLSAGRAVSEQDLESSRDAMDAAQAHLEVAQKSLDLSEVGPRKEDIAQAEAQLRASQAQFELLRQQLRDSELIAPSDGVVRTRLLEPGAMASPQNPVLSLALMDPKWVRAYVSETDLGRIHAGMTASVSTDSYPGRSLPGWVGFIASMAEFTPKSVETVALRSSLVYEIRVFVQDPQDQLRLGMPATVQLELDPGTRPKP